MANLPRKCRTREHILADLSVHHVEGHVLLCGWVVVGLRSLRDMPPFWQKGGMSLGAPSPWRTLALAHPRRTSDDAPLRPAGAPESRRRAARLTGPSRAGAGPVRREQRPV